MATLKELADLLRLNDGEQAYTGYPQMQVGLTKPRQAGTATGFLESATGLPSMQPKNPITDPNYEAYAQGQNYGNLANAALMAAPSIAALAKNPQVLARAASPLYRPQVTTEAAVTSPATLLNAPGNAEAELLSRQRYNTAASQNLKNDVTQRQGAWMADGKLEANPMYVAKTERTLNVGKNAKTLKEVAQAATNLEQEGAAITRAIPLPYGDLSKGNAAFLTNNGKPLSNNDIKKLADSIGTFGDTVLQHRADGKGLIFKAGYDDSMTLQQIVDKAKETIPGLKIRPALSSEGIDRKYLDKSDYAQAGAMPREADRQGQLTQAFDEILKSKGYRKE